MGTTRFRPTVYPLETRDVPVSGVTPQQVFDATGFVRDTPAVLGYFEEEFEVARAGGAGQTLLAAADLNRGAAATLTGFLNDALEAVAVNPASAPRLNELAGMAGVLIVQANNNAAAAELLAARLGVARPVPPPPPATGDPNNSVINPRPDLNPPTSPPVSPTPPVTATPPGDGSSLPRSVPSLSDPGFTPVGTQGLRVRDVRAGEGTVATATSSTTVRYRGFLASDGSQFDTNVDNADSTRNVPFEAVIDPARRNVINGFAEGIVGMRVGGIRTIDIPPELGYGDSPRTGIPANSRLVFVVQLLSVA